MGLAVGFGAALARGTAARLGGGGKLGSILAAEDLDPCQHHNQFNTAPPPNILTSALAATSSPLASSSTQIIMRPQSVHSSALAKTVPLMDSQEIHASKSEGLVATSVGFLSLSARVLHVAQDASKNYTVVC